MLIYVFFQIIIHSLGNMNKTSAMFKEGRTEKFNICVPTFSGMISIQQERFIGKSNEVHKTFSESDGFKPTPKPEDAPVATPAAKRTLRRRLMRRRAIGLERCPSVAERHQLSVMNNIDDASIDDLLGASDSETPKAEESEEEDSRSSESGSPEVRGSRSLSNSSSSSPSTSSSSDSDTSSSDSDTSSSESSEKSSPKRSSSDYTERVRDEEHQTAVRSPVTTERRVIISEEFTEKEEGANPRTYSRVITSMASDDVKKRLGLKCNEPRKLSIQTTAKMQVNTAVAPSQSETSRNPTKSISSIREAGKIPEVLRYKIPKVGPIYHAKRGQALPKVGGPSKVPNVSSNQHKKVMQRGSIIGARDSGVGQRSSEVSHKRGSQEPSVKDRSQRSSTNTATGRMESQHRGETSRLKRPRTAGSIRDPIHRSQEETRHGASRYELSGSKISRPFRQNQNRRPALNANYDDGVFGAAHGITCRHEQHSGKARDTDMRTERSGDQNPSQTRNRRHGGSISQHNDRLNVLRGSKGSSREEQPAHLRSSLSGQIRDTSERRVSFRERAGRGDSDDDVIKFNLREDEDDM